MLHSIGSGNFGQVYKGTWLGSTEVALKKLKSDKAEEFLTEVSTLESLSHNNIVQYFGIYMDAEGESYMVTEYMNKGSAKDLLCEETLDTEDLVSMYITLHVYANILSAFDSAVGMAYLESQSIIHRDLALRTFIFSLLLTHRRQYLGKYCA